MSVVLEIRAFASQELYEEVVPRLEAAGFRPRGDLNWSDPETDGEYGGMYFEYALEEALPVERFASLVAELRSSLEKVGPSAQFNLVHPRRIRGR